MSRKPLQTLTQEIIDNAGSQDPEVRLSAAMAFWGLASKLGTESALVQREVCLAVLPVISPLTTESDAIKVPILKGFRDLCQLIPLHDVLIEQGVLGILLSTVVTRQSQRVLLACLFSLAALAGNNNETVAMQVATRIFPRLVGLLSARSQSVVANVLALINVLALYRNLAPILFAESDLLNRMIDLQEHGEGHVKSNAKITKERLCELKDFPIGPNRARSGEEVPVPPSFAAAFPPSAIPSMVAATPFAPISSNRLPGGPIPLGKDRRSRETRSNKNDILVAHRVTSGGHARQNSDLETEHASSEPALAKIHIQDDIPEGSPLLTQQSSISQLPMQKTTSVPNLPVLGSPSNELALERKSSLPRMGDDVLVRVPSRDRSDGGIARSKSNESPRIALQRRDSKPTRTGSDQRKREPRRVSGEDVPLYIEGERIANLDKAFENNGKWPESLSNMQFREPKASTLPGKKHGAFEVKKRKGDERVQAWLDWHNFGEYSDQFAADKITYDTLLRLTMEDLDHLGVHALGDRKRMLWQIQKDAKRKSKRENVIHIAVLQSNPLNGPETPGFPNKLDLRGERSILCDSFRESGRQIRVRFAPATCDNLLKMLTKGCRALHISGHGDPRNLMLEDGKGGSKDLDVATLRHMLELGGKETLQFVFISACFSSTAANAFVEAGVPHVIAVQESVQVCDVSARNFARHVYMALCQGLTVEKAYNKGQAGVLAIHCPKPCCCAHLHAPNCALCPQCRTPVCCTEHVGEGCHVVTQCCAPQIPHNENLKFLLRPPTIDHNVKLFDEVGLGEWVNCTPDKIINNLPSTPDHFAGRSKDMLCVVQTLLKPTRLVTISGASGIGKSALARAVASYVHERRHFEGGCFLLKLGPRSQVEQIHQALEEAMVTAPKPKDAKNTLYKSVLYVFDNCDNFINDLQNQTKFRDYLQAFMERHAQATVLMTSRQSMGNIDFLTHRVLNLGPLHPLDSVALYLNRIPRDLGVQDFGDSDLGSNMTSLQQLALYPLFPKLKGNPRLIELCAEMLKYMPLCDLERCLSIPTSKWPNMAEPVQLLLLRIKTFGTLSYQPQPEPERQMVNPELQEIQQLQRQLGLSLSLCPPQPSVSSQAPPGFVTYPQNLAPSYTSPLPESSSQFPNSNYAFASTSTLPCPVRSVDSATLIPPSIAPLAPSITSPPLIGSIPSTVPIASAFPGLSSLPSIIPSTIPSTIPSVVPSAVPSPSTTFPSIPSAFPSLSSAFPSLSTILSAMPSTTPLLTPVPVIAPAPVPAPVVVIPPALAGVAATVPPSGTIVPGGLGLAVPSIPPVTISPSTSTAESIPFSTPASTPSSLLPSFPSPLTSPLPSDEPVEQSPSSPSSDVPVTTSTPSADSQARDLSAPTDNAVAVHLAVGIDDVSKVSPSRNKVRLPLPSSKPPPVPTSSSPPKDLAQLKQATLACPTTTRVKNSPPPPSRPPPPTSAAKVR